MPYNEPLADRVRRIFEEKKVSNVEEKKMMGGLTFMVNEKRCIGIVKDDLMVRLNRYCASCFAKTFCKSVVVRSPRLARMERSFCSTIENKPFNASFVT